MSGDDKKKNIIITPKTGDITVSGQASYAMIRSGKAAVEKLSTATTVATATGHQDIAAATQGLSIQLVQNFYISGGTLNIDQQQNFTLNQQTITQIEALTNNLTDTLRNNNVEFFDCKNARDECIRGATTLGERVECKLLYAACLGAKTASALRPK